MSLIDEMMVNCVIINRAIVDDPEGGHKTTWSEGASIKCAIVCDNSMNAKRAEKEGVTSNYTITTHTDVILDYHTVIKRVSDGRIFRITSEPQDQVAKIGSLDMRQVSAEKWELTND